MADVFGQNGIEIFNGDCMKILPTLEANSVDAVITDIPFGEVNRETNGLRKFDKGLADIVDFDLIAMAKELDRVCKGSFYVFCGVQQLGKLDEYWISQGYSRRSLIWEKTNPSPVNGQHVWISGIEHISFAKKPGATFNAFCRNCVIRCEKGSNKTHPTQKPIKLIRDLISVATNPSDVVLDPFLGSGTTAVACVELGMKCIGIEKNEEYFNNSVERVKQTIQLKNMDMF